MIFVATEIPDVYTVELERRADERGFFARAGGVRTNLAIAACLAASCR